MNVIVVAHPDRLKWVELLQRHISVVAVVVDTVSARSGHLTALRLASQHDERVVIMEDDAIPVEGFDERSDWWADARPGDLLSFYLGTSRPKQFQALVDKRMAVADEKGDIALCLPQLIHGVCYSIPQQNVAEVVYRMERLNRVREADFAIGAAWGREVCYPLESLVQHRDETPVERHPDGQPRTEARVARRLAAPLMFNPT